MSLLFTPPLYAFFRSKAEFKAEAYSFNDDNDPTTEDGGLSLSSLLSVKWKKKGWRGRMQVKALTDRENRERDNLIIQDLWAGYKFGWFLFELGYQIDSWSNLESFKPLDVLNSRDFESEYIDPEKIGEFLAKMKFSWNSGDISFYYAPWFEPPRYPPPSSRLRISPIPFGKAQWINKDGTKNEGNHDTQFGLRFNQKAGQSDLQIFYFEKQDRKFPLITFNATELTPHYLPVREIGFGYSQAVESTLLKAEFVHRQFLNENVSLITIDGLQTQPNHVELAMGAEYSFTTQSGWEHTFYIEMQNLSIIKSDIFSDWESKQLVEKEQAMSLFQRDISLAYRLNLNDTKSREIGLFFVTDLERSKEVTGGLSYNQRFLKVWKLETGFSFVDAPIKEATAVGLESQHNNNRFYLKTTRFF